ncbi:MAG: transporter [Pseudomonadales bacterium]|nr:transporter [Pseudomonadales bacterium]
MKNIVIKLSLVLLFAAQSALAVDFHGSLGEGKHTRYIPPISNPLFNETPFITTELRPIILINEIPDDFVTTGGTIKIIAAEIRVALSDRLGFIASKDGYADIDFDAVLPDETGSANISLGLKYAIFSDPSTGSIFTVGLEYEAPIGTLETGGIDLQGQGDGFIDTFISGATTVGRWGIQGNAGYNKALDDEHDSSLLHLSGHVNYMVNDWFFPTLELNVFTTRAAGERLPFDFEGIDLVNFGSSNANGTVTTMAVGARFIFNDNMMFGVAYEAPVSNRKDIMDHRFYFDMVWHF